MAKLDGIAGKIFLPCAVVVFFILSGCMRYSIDSAPGLEFGEIYVAPVKNDAFAPQVQALLTKHVREKLARQPNVKVAKSAASAVVLDVTIVAFEQSAASILRDDTMRAQSFDVKMTVACTLEDRATGRVFFKNHRLSDSVECHVGGDYQSARHQMMPQLTQKLADKICEIVCNPW
ncbi:MAG: LPS assembly lipoprotein LptE [Puniceicoccales bacterium]|nr:LPS assembly lipoprotein LptE [Puniceicoccales bacterium]